MAFGTDDPEILRVIGTSSSTSSSSTLFSSYQNEISMIEKIFFMFDFSKFKIFLQTIEEWKDYLFQFEFPIFWILACLLIFIFLLFLRRKIKNLILSSYSNSVQNILKQN